MIGVKSVKTYFGTNAERTAIAVNLFNPGDVFTETDTKITYQHNGMAWIKTAVDGVNYLPLAGGNVTGDLSVDDDLFFSDVSAGFIGIGTALPLALLHLFGDAGMLILQGATSSRLDFIDDESATGFRRFAFALNAESINLSLRENDGSFKKSFISFDTNSGMYQIRIQAPIDMTGTDNYLRLAQLTTTQRNALTVANGIIIYNTTTNKIQGYAGGSWVDLH